MLSALLWCFVVYVIVRLSGDGMYIIQGYADDICLFAVGKFPNTMSGLMHLALHCVKTGCKEVGLSVNPDKTELVVFTRRRKLPGFFEPHFFVVTLSLSRSVKYLGAIVDTRLTWRKHVDVNARKAHNLLGSCRKFYGATWGLTPRVLHWLYVYIIRPSVAFASLVWWPGCQTASAKKRLSRVPQRAY